MPQAADKISGRGFLRCALETATDPQRAYRPPPRHWTSAVNLKPHARRAFIAAYERRLQQEVTHPVFGYRVSARRLLEVQARLLARYLDGEIEGYPHYLVR
jgi:hypothetical protein